MVGERNNRVVAFIIYELHTTRFHILNLAVAEDCRRLGVGTQLVERLIGKLSEERRSRVSLEVRESNLDAQLFFRARGFKATNVLHEFYPQSPEDAYVMHYRIRELAET